MIGAISNIDLNRNTFEIEGKTFTASESDAVGVKLSTLKEGDKISVEVKGPMEVMAIERAE